MHVFGIIKGLMTIRKNQNVQIFKSLWKVTSPKNSQRFGMIQVEAMLNLSVK